MARLCPDPPHLPTRSPEAFASWLRFVSLGLAPSVGFLDVLGVFGKLYDEMSRARAQTTHIIVGAG